MYVANPIGTGGADQLRFKTLGALTAVMGGMSSQTAERMRAGDAIEKALREVAHNCLGIDWEYVYNELGIKLELSRFNLCEVAGVRKIPMMPEVTVAHTIACLKANKCGVLLTPTNLDLGLVRSGRAVNDRPYLVTISDCPLGEEKSRLETKVMGILEPTLNEWLLLQLGYVICSGFPWGNNGYVRCGNSEIGFPGRGGIGNPSVSRHPSGLIIAVHGEDMKWGYLSTMPVKDVTC